MGRKVPSFAEARTIALAETYAALEPLFLEETVSAESLLLSSKALARAAYAIRTMAMHKKRDEKFDHFEKLRKTRMEKGVGRQHQGRG